MKSYVLRGALLLALLLAAHLAPAQSEPPEGGPEPDAPTAVPIDGGASLLLAAGLGLGVRKLRQRRQPK